MTTESTPGWYTWYNTPSNGAFSSNWGDNTCSHTGAAGDWTKLNLASSSYVEVVRILNRKDCCSDRIDGIGVYVWSTTGGTYYPCGILLSSNEDSNGWITVTCPYNAYGN